MEDETLECRDCSAEFVYRIAQQSLSTVWASRNSSRNRASTTSMMRLLLRTEQPLQPPFHFNPAQGPVDRDNPTVAIALKEEEEEEKEILSTLNIRMSRTL